MPVSLEGDLAVFRTWTLALSVALSMTAATLASAADGGPANVTDKRLLNAASEPSQWMTYGGTYSEQRYSKLAQINKQNVKDLGLVWFADYDTNLQQTGTPLAIDGVLYVSTAWSKVYAFDAKTGKTLWKYDPKTPGQWIANVCCGIVNRGIAAYEGHIFIGTLDGRLVAINAKTGKEDWSVLTIDKTKHYSITSAPRVAKGMVLIGNSGGEYGVRGYVSAYDARSGKLIWRFYTVPGNPADGFENAAMKKAAATWSDGWWKLGGGGTVWDALIYDPVTDLVYFGTGNGTPWNQANRDTKSGDNLYLASVIAVKPGTGEYVWHYQSTPQDTWDYDAVSPLMTADLSIEGEKRHVLLQPCKNGFYYVLDAKSGEVLLAEPFTLVNWAHGVDLETGRPRVNPEARYASKPWNLAPGVQGAHGWHSNAYSPDTGLIYVPTQDAWFPMVADPNYKPSATGYNLGIDFASQVTYYRDNPGAKRGFVGYLQAMDPATGKQLWKSTENQGPTGGALATAGGLVFQGAGSGQELRAFDAKTGQKLWSTQTQTAVLAAPITFEVDGKQYIAQSVGGNTLGGYYAPNYSRMLVFALGGKVQLPPTKEFTPLPLNPPASTATAQVIEAGRAAYAQNCAQCHGENGQTRGANFPDLTRTPLLHTQEGFDQIVLKGVLAEKGMASFADALKPADTAAVRAFLVSRANELKNAPPPGAPPGAATGNQHEEGK
jgi:alcohol dehydrogenase (cytochrome c)/quinohemoprotein ethanol dehydrogenase